MCRLLLVIIELINISPVFEQVKKEVVTQMRRKKKVAVLMSTLNKRSYGRTRHTTTVKDFVDTVTLLQILKRPTL